jgi:hypothetical protein
LEANQQPVGLGLDFGGIVTVEIHIQPGLALRKTNYGALAAAEAHRIHDRLVDAFHRSRGELEDGFDVPRRVHHVRVAEAHQQSARRFGHQLHPGSGDDRARTLGPHQGPGHVETLLRQQVVQVVPRDLPLDPAQLHAEVGQVVVGQFLELICQGCGTRLRLLVLRVRGAQRRGSGGEPGTIGGDDVELHHVVRRAAVADRMVAARVVAQRAAYGGAVLRRRVRGEGEAVSGCLLHLAREHGEHHARVHRHGARRLVDPVDPVHVPGEVQHHAWPDRVARH